MKNKHTLATALALLALGAGPLLAQTTTWYYDTSNNAAAAGSTATVFTDIGAAWQDVQVSQVVPGGFFGGASETAATPTAQFVNDISFQVWAFGNLGIASGDITAASLRVTVESILTQPPGAPATWTIFGYTGGAVNQNTMNYTNTSPDINTAINFGSFGTAGNYVGGSWFNIDVTSALQAYTAGTIDGIVIGNTTDSPLLTGADFTLQFNTSEDPSASLRPGLQVTTMPIPEPSAALLGACGALALLRRRRA
jgi:hypothetical protein